MAFPPSTINSQPSTDSRSRSPTTRRLHAATNDVESVASAGAIAIREANILFRATDSQCSGSESCREHHFGLQALK